MTEWLSWMTLLFGSDMGADPSPPGPPKLALVEMGGDPSPPGPPK